MIPVRPADEPGSFHKQVRIPGLRCTAEMVGKTPPYGRSGSKPCKQSQRSDGTAITSERDLPPGELKPFWTKCLPELMTAYDEICAYSCFRIHPVTGAGSVDHFAAKSQAWDKVYEWDNYRLCCSRMNSRKQDFGNVLDPFDVEPGWFELEFVGFTVFPGKNLDPNTRQAVLDTIERLKLNDDGCCRARKEHFNNYKDELVTFKFLLRESPFVAQEMKRKGLNSHQTAQSWAAGKG